MQTPKNETYKQQLIRHSQEVEAFPKFFAFSQKQFEEGMKKLGLRPTDSRSVLSIPGTGGYIRRSDFNAFSAMISRHAQERKDAIAADITGEGFIRQMFLYELSNHEYGYTGDLEETLDCLGLTEEQIQKNSALSHGLQLALAKFQ